MDFLDFRAVSFFPSSSIGRLCDDLNNIVGQGVWCDTFQVQNKKWLWLLNDIVTTMNSDNVVWFIWSVPELCGRFPKLCEGNSFLRVVQWKVKLRRLCWKNEYSGTYKPHRRDEFQLSSSSQTIALSFEARQFPKLPSELIFAQSVLKKICLSSLAFGIVCIKKRVTYITNKVLTSWHDCVFERYTCDLELPKKLAGCTMYTRYCSMYHKKTCPFYILYCTKKSHLCFEKLSAIVNYVWKTDLQV